ncbi:MAG: hypothetical protein D6795_20380 [Deltaproteobacteria bacterium]|nr:MAG: hypothetical protein D6795_20380 [Deltaproteobacteria bacterium]
MGAVGMKRILLLWSLTWGIVTIGRAEDSLPHPGHDAWRLSEPIVKTFAILDPRRKVLYPVREHLMTPADIPHIETYWKCQGVFDWPCLIDPTIRERRKRGEAKPWRLAPGVPSFCEETHAWQVWGAELTRKGKTTIEGMIAWRDLPSEGRTEIAFGETRFRGGYIGVGTIGLAYAVQKALLKGYEPYVNAYKYPVPDGRPSPIEWFKGHGLVPTFAFDTPSDTVRLVFPDLEAAKKFLRKVQGYMEKDPIVTP